LLLQIPAKIAIERESDEEEDLLGKRKMGVIIQWSLEVRLMTMIMRPVTLDYLGREVVVQDNRLTLNPSTVVTVIPLKSLLTFKKQNLECFP
jgi:hypothetical protein